MAAGAACAGPVLCTPRPAPQSPDKYGLADSAPDDTPGVFADEVFAKMYLDYLDVGEGSLLDALNVGVLVETFDIDDLKTAVENTDKSDLEWVYGNLLTASENHLAAFTRNIEASGACTLQNTGGRQSGQAGTLSAQGRGNGGGRGSCDRQRKRDGSCLPGSSV